MPNSLSNSHTQKGPDGMPSLKKNTVCNTGRKAISDLGEVFSELVSVSAKQLTLARNNLFSPLSITYIFFLLNLNYLYSLSFLIRSVMAF